MVPLSIVIPLYNKEKSISSTIESVLAQTYTNYEVIIVNDGSTDNSLSIIQTFEDSRIKIVNKENGGVSSARNRGIKESKYEWIAFLDGDDLWNPGFLENVIILIEKYPLSYVIALGWMGDNNTVPTKLFKFNEGYIDDYIFEFINCRIICSSSVAIKSSCFKEIGYFKENLTYGEDLEMWCTLAKNYKIAYSPIEMTIYRHNAENRACSQHKINIKKHIAYHIKLSALTLADEKKIKKNIVKETLFNCLYFGDFKSFFILFKKNGILNSTLYLIEQFSKTIHNKIKQQHDACAN